MKKFKEVLKKDVDSDAAFKRALDNSQGIFVLDSIDARLMHFDSIDTVKKVYKGGHLDLLIGEGIYDGLSFEVEEEMLTHEDFIKIKNKVVNFGKRTITSEEIDHLQKITNRTERSRAINDLMAERSIRLW